jgi:vesicle-fusing ATPase
MTGSFKLNESISSSIFIANADVALNSMSIAIDRIKKSDTSKLEIDCEEISEYFKKQYKNQVFCINQKLFMDFGGNKLEIIILEIEHAHLDLSNNNNTSNNIPKPRGQLRQITEIKCKKQQGSTATIIFTNAKGTSTNDSLFKQDFNFEKLGIGGLGAQFQTMFRRAFASRIFPGLVKQLGINHVRGMLLYGPPGCGKTLIARQIGKCLNAREPKIINGPEILDKYVGESESKIRALFADAEKEQAEMGDESLLHIIIFDEMDAVMKTRGTSGSSSGVSDSIVNQLLSKIDGVDSLNNILIIGMTNRKDMIDDAILRPGRLEVHIEISLPTEEGRLQILNIHTSEMKKNERISNEALENLPEMASLTKNYTGAEIEGLVRNAASFSLARNIDASSLKAIDVDQLSVDTKDFQRAFSECIPAFGSKDNSEILGYMRNGICEYGMAYYELWATLQRLLNQTRTSKRTPLLSVLLEGPSSTGKTAIAAKLCTESDFPFVRIITADSMIGLSESQKCSKLLQVFSDSYKSELSIIFIDDIERIIEYNPSGPRFSNTVLQTLMILLRRVPPRPPPITGIVQPDPRLLVLGTTSISDLLEDIQLSTVFNVRVHVSQLQNAQEIQSVLQEYSEISAEEIYSIANSDLKPIGIKQLLMVLEMATVDESSASITKDSFFECLHSVGF